MNRVTLSDIGRKLGYTKNTVSLALRGRKEIPEATRRRISQVADELGYKPNPVVSALMAQLRGRQTAEFVATLGLVNANRDRDAFKNHPTIPAYVEGCERRAANLGYTLDRFWLHDPTMDAASWLRVLQRRRVQGMILVGLMDQKRLPPHLRPIWESFPTVVTGVHTSEPALSYCCVDHFDLEARAVIHARNLGYDRPGLVMEESIDRLVEYRFSAGFTVGRQAAGIKGAVPTFRRFMQARDDPSVFGAWLDRYKPDVLFTLYNTVFDWLKALDQKVPEDLGVIQLEWRSSRPHVAGMNQHNNITGEAAVDLLVSLLRNNEHGVPAFPRATLIGATWTDGATVRDLGERLAAEPTPPLARAYL